MNKKGFAIMTWLIITGLVAGVGGFTLFQANKTIENIGGGYLGIPIFGWIVIVLLLLILIRSRK